MIGAVTIKEFIGMMVVFAFAVGVVILLWRQMYDIYQEVCYLDSIGYYDEDEE